MSGCEQLMSMQNYHPRRMYSPLRGLQSGKKKDCPEEQSFMDFLEAYPR
jgi:hypothetical protein